MSSGVLSGPPTEAFRSEISDTNLWREKMPTQMMQRSAFGKLGKTANVNINSYLVTSFPTKQVYQYDVSACPLIVILYNAELFGRL